MMMMMMTMMTMMRISAQPTPYQIQRPAAAGYKRISSLDANRTCWTGRHLTYRLIKLNLETVDRTNGL
eukprot:2231013-Karenia_brevis.AAC.1